MESRSSPASPNVPSFPWIGAVLGKLIRVSMSNDINKSDVTTQEMSQTVEDTQSKLMSTVEIAANESSNVVGDSSFKSTVNSDKTVHELMDLMERPTLIKTGKVTSTTTEMVYSYDKSTFDAMGLGNIPGLVTTFTFPEVLIAKNPVVADKIKQFTFLKADINFELKINCPPNVSGSLLVVYIPLIEELPFDFSNLTVQGLTSFPSKILDYSVDTSLSMTVPYINQYDFYNRFQTNVSSGYPPLNTPGSYGGIAIFNLQTPLSSSTADFVSYSAFASFENVELVLPSVDPLSLPGPSVADSRFFAESGNIIRRIPASDIMSGSNESQDLKLSYNTTPPKFDAITYDNNEMDLSYVLKRENIIGKVVYDKNTDAENASYFGKVRCFPKRVFIENCAKKPIQMGTFDYASNLFGRYTGTVKIGLRIIKTKFHYGRFAVIFDPYNRLDVGATPTSINTLLSTNYGMIIDLNGNDGEEGGSNYYSIEIPYMNNAGFSLIGNEKPGSFVSKGSKNVPYDSGNPFFTASRECYNPYLRFYAITELGYLSSAADKVPILLSICAGDDFQLSIPRVNVQLADPPIEADPFYCESGLRITPNTTKTAKDNTLMCNGEDITSLKELANRFTSPTVPSSRIPGYMALSDDQTNAGVPQLEPGGVVLSLHNNTLKGFKQSNYEAVANIFRFAYGGRRYKMMSVGPSYMMSRLLHVPNYTGPSWANKETPSGKLLSPGFGYDGRYAIAPSATATVPLSGEMVVENEINNFLEVERPFYSNRKLISTRQPFQPTPNVDALPCADDIFTQFVAISKNEIVTRSINITDPLATHIRIGPCLIADDTTRPIIPSTNVVSSSLDDDQKSGFILEHPDLCFKERDFIVNDTYAGTDSIKITKIVTGDVLEALGTGAGLTFLQAPPCVIFG